MEMFYTAKITVLNKFEYISYFLFYSLSCNLIWTLTRVVPSFSLTPLQDLFFTCGVKKDEAT